MLGVLFNQISPNAVGVDVAQSLLRLPAGSVNTLAAIVDEVAALVIKAKFAERMFSFAMFPELASCMSVPTCTASR